MYGWDEVTKWPSIFNIQNDKHLPCVPASPAFRERYPYDPFPEPLDNIDWTVLEALWASIEPVHWDGPAVVSFDDSVSLSRFSQSYVKKLVDARTYVDELVGRLCLPMFFNQSNFEFAKRKLGLFSIRVEEAILPLTTLDLPYVQALLRVREVQRLLLEMLGIIVFHTICIKRGYAQTEPAGLVYPCIGGIGKNLSDLAMLHRLGIPVWMLVHHSEIFKGDIRRYNMQTVPLSIESQLSLQDFCVSRSKSDSGSHVTIYKNHPLNTVSHLYLKRDWEDRTRRLQTTLPPRVDAMVGTDASAKNDAPEETLSVEAPRERQESHTTCVDPEEVPLKTPPPQSPPQSAIPIFVGPITHVLTASSKRRCRLSKNVSRRQKSDERTFGSIFSTLDLSYEERLCPVFLKAVERLHDHPCVSSEPLPLGLHPIPPPSLFVKDSKERANRIVRWLIIRPAWTYSTFIETPVEFQSLSVDVWRSLLSDDITREYHQEGMNVRRLKRQKKREEAREEAQALHAEFPELFFLESDELVGCWNDSMWDQDSLMRYPELKIQIMYELHHLGFLSEFMSLDFVMAWHLGTTLLLSRRRRFFKMFGAQLALDAPELTFADPWGASSIVRHDVLRTWFRLMSDWPDSPKEWRRVDILSLDEERSGKMEMEMVECYVRLFAHHFRRWPVIPMIRPVSLDDKYETYKLNKRLVDDELSA